MKINYPNYHLTSVSQDELEKYPSQAPVTLKDGEIVKIVGQPAVYVISNGKKHPVISGDVYEKLGYKWNNIKEIEARTLSNIPLGANIDLDYKK